MDRFEPVVDAPAYGNHGHGHAHTPVYHRGRNQSGRPETGYDDEFHDEDYDDAPYGIIDRVLAAPGKLIMTVAVIAVFGLVGTNAAYWQPGAHPSPMLSTRGAAPAEPLPTEVLAATSRTVTMAPSPIVPPSRLYDRTASISQLQAEIGAGVDLARAPYLAPAPVPRPDLSVQVAAQSVPAPIAQPQTAIPAQPVQSIPVQTIAVNDPIGALLAPVTATQVAAQSGQLQGQPAAVTRSAQPVVAAVQSVLADLGYAPGVIDGVMGASTEEAIRRFQLRRALEPNGQITSDLLREIERVTGTRISPS